MTGLLGFLAVPLAITGVFLLFRLFFPRKGSADGAARPFDAAERKRYHRIHLLTTLAFPVAVAGLAYLLSLILPLIDLGPNPGPDLLFVGRPAPTAWLLAGVFAGLGLAILLIDRLEALFLKEDVARLREFQSDAYGFNAAKVRSFMLTSALAAGFLFAALMLDWRFYIRKDKAVLDGFMSITEEPYPFRDVSAILTAPASIAPNGDTVARREYAVRMQDGRAFNSLYLPGVTPENCDSLFALIALLSGKGLTQKPVLERDDLR